MEYHALPVGVDGGMTPSKHLSQETTFEGSPTGALCCAQCRATFVYEKDPGGDIWKEPRFCPECGRRNADG